MQPLRDLHLKILGRVELRCREHARFQPACRACCFLRKAEYDLVALRSRRDHVFRELKDKLASRELIMIDLR